MRNVRASVVYLGVLLVQIGIFVFAADVLKIGFWASLGILVVITALSGIILEVLAPTTIEGITAGSLFLAAIGMLITPTDYVSLQLALRGEVPIIFNLPGLLVIYLLMASMAKIGPLHAIPAILLLWSIAVFSEAMYARGAKSPQKKPR